MILRKSRNCEVQATTATALLGVSCALMAGCGSIFDAESSYCPYKEYNQFFVAYADYLPAPVNCLSLKLGLPPGGREIHRLTSTATSRSLFGCTATTSRVN